MHRKKNYIVEIPLDNSIRKHLQLLIITDYSHYKIPKMEYFFWCLILNFIF
jgi:hypothetical protein